MNARATFLDDTQRGILAESQEQFRSMQEINMRMGLQFMKGGQQQQGNNN